LQSINIRLLSLQIKRLIYLPV